MASSTLSSEERGEHRDGAHVCEQSLGDGSIAAHREMPRGAGELEFVVPDVETAQIILRILIAILEIGRDYTANRKLLARQRAGVTGALNDIDRRTIIAGGWRGDSSATSAYQEKH